MKITSKNLAIMMVMIFLIFNHFIGLAWEVVKSFVYCILFMFLLKQISPELYEYLMNVFDFKNFKFSNIPKSISLIVNKILSFIPFMRKKNCPKIQDEKK